MRKDDTSMGSDIFTDKKHGKLTYGHIVDTTDYAYWRELANKSPLFAAMKASALHNTSTETCDVMGANALAYILDPANKTRYIDQIRNKLDTRITTMNIAPNASGSSVRSHELFFTLLALDVIRHDLEAEILAKYDSIVKSKIMQLVIGRWDPHGWAMRMLYYKFTGDKDNFLTAKAQWENGLAEHYMPGDGVSPAGNGYCVQRWNSIERSAKNTMLDIMEYMGYHEYYTNPGIIGLKEFIYGYAVSPFGRIILYGDSRDTEAQKAWHVRGDTILSPHIVSAARFSPEAYKYAMWVLREGANINKPTLIGYLSNYIIMAGTAAGNKPLKFDSNDAKLAPSRLFKNYAALITDEQSRDALYLSMLNLTGNTEYHTHYETNALAMAGYGEILLRNAGYDGPNNDINIDGVKATFDFIHSNSESSNTLMINGERHTTKTGDGITEGFIGQDVEYFRGTSSTAIDGTHFRDGIFVQPSNGANGYFIVMDHVTSNSPKGTVNVIWHPNSSNIRVIKNETEYFSEIKVEDGADGPRIYTKNKATLTTLLATPPSSVEIKRTANQARSGYAYAADYIYANYHIIDNKANILTVLFPADKRHPTAHMTRITSEDYTGSEITQKKVVDVALTSSGTSANHYDSKYFQGEDILFRTVSGKFTSYFTKGTFFYNKQKIKIGFEADQTITLYMNHHENNTGMRGIINSEGAKVTFYYPALSTVKLNGDTARVVTSGPNWIQVNIPSGHISIELISQEK
ncbi:hypothetical protein [Saccharicrinis fermentans]|nr:hypothetical protein [Saccharicrinis fermentans]